MIKVNQELKMVFVHKDLYREICDEIPVVFLRYNIKVK